MHNMVEVSYLTLPVESGNQGISLIEYLHRHGVTAAADGPDAVTVPMERDAAEHIVATVNGLFSSWQDYWNYFDAELFGLPVFVRDHNEGDHCPSCGAGPVVG